MSTKMKTRLALLGVVAATLWGLLGHGCAQQGDGGPASSTQAGGAAAGSAGSAGKGPSVAGAGVGGAGAGAAPGQAGKGGASWTGPIGVGGMSPQGKTPVWKPVPGDPLGAGVEYLENGEEFSVFSWAPCSTIAGCEVTKFSVDAATISGDGNAVFGSGGGLYAGGDSARLYLFVTGARPEGLWLWLLPDESGRLLGGMRMRDQQHPGLTRIASDSQDMFIGVVRSTPIEELSEVSSLVGIKWNWGAKKLDTFDLPVQPHFMTTTSGRVTAGRVSLGWSRIDAGALSSFSKDGTGPRLIAGPGQPQSYLSVSTSPHDSSDGHFYFASYISEPNNSYHVSIHRSDGIESPTSYLEPEPGWDLGRFGYAHSHIAWVRATGWKDINYYTKGELWSAPFEEDPTKLQPVKLADIAPVDGVVNNIAEVAAGWGHYALWEAPDAKRNIRIWNLAKRTSKAFKVPDDREVSTFLGMTKTHLYLGLARVAENEIFELIRVEVD